MNDGLPIEALGQGDPSVVVTNFLDKVRKAMVWDQCGTCFSGEAKLRRCKRPARRLWTPVGDSGNIDEQTLV